MTLYPIHHGSVPNYLRARESLNFLESSTVCLCMDIIESASRLFYAAHQPNGCESRSHYWTGCVSLTELLDARELILTTVVHRQCG